MDIWTTWITGGILVTGALTLFLANSAKYLSLREFEYHRVALIRELDIVSKRMEYLEQTRPTTGELEARLQTGKFGKNGI
jgi:hypothetical protein